VQETISSWLVGTVIPGVGAALFVALLGLTREWVRGLKDQRMRHALGVLVEAAEQIYGPGKGETKRRFVRDRLKQQGLPQVGREDLESAVYNLSRRAG
jgi:hypothetical protein